MITRRLGIVMLVCIVALCLAFACHVDIQDSRSRGLSDLPRIADERTAFKVKRVLTCEPFDMNVLAHPWASVEPSEHYKRLARQMNAAKIQPGRRRLEYFSKYYGDRQAREVVGWTGIMSDVREVEGGTLVTLRVQTKLRGTFFDSTHFMEDYLVNGKGVVLVATRPQDEGKPHLRFGL